MVHDIAGPPPVNAPRPRLASSMAFERTAYTRWFPCRRSKPTAVYETQARELTSTFHPPSVRRKYCQIRPFGRATFAQLRENPSAPTPRPCPLAGAKLGSLAALGEPPPDIERYVRQQAATIASEVEYVMEPRRKLPFTTAARAQPLEFRLKAQTLTTVEVVVERTTI